MSINLNDNIKVNAGKPLDSKYLNGTTPYANIAEVNSTIALSERYLGLTVLVVNKEYWYKTSTLDAGLIEKIPDGLPTVLAPIGCSIDGLGSPIQSGAVGFSAIIYSGTIAEWTIIGDQVGEVQFDIKRNGVSIVGAGNKPAVVAILGTETSASESVVGWTSNTVTAGDFIEYVIENSYGFQRLSLFLKITT